MFMKQMEFRLPTWGGKRRGAGRKPKGKNALVARLRREEFPSRHPVHVTVRTLFGAGYLRGARLFKGIANAIRQCQGRFGMQVVHFSVQGNHLHLLVETEGQASLARGMQGLTIRIAKTVNRASRRHGKVFADRYHAHVMSSRREVANALRYVLENVRHHLREDVVPEGIDPCSSAAWVGGVVDGVPVRPARTWLLRNAHAPPAAAAA